MTNPLDLLKEHLEYNITKTHTSADYIEAFRDGVYACNCSVTALEQWMYSWYRIPKDCPLQGSFLEWVGPESERDIQSAIDFGFTVYRLYK